MARIDDLKKETRELEEQASIKKTLYENDMRYGVPTLEKIEKLTDKILENEKKIKTIKEAGNQGRRVNLEKTLDKLSKSALGNMNKQLGFKSLEKKLNEDLLSDDKDRQKIAQNVGDLLNDIAEGKAGVKDVTDAMLTDDLGKYLETIGGFADLLEEFPNLQKKLSLEKEAQDKINNFRDKISEASAFLSSPLAMGVAVVGLLVQQMVDFAQKTLEVRQNLGTSVVESARLAGNMKVAGLAAKSVGGSSEEAEAAISAMVDEFGTTGSISSDLAISLGRVTGQFGISGANAAKLLKSMQGINGASAETNLSLISAVGELARAEGVAPGAVLNDIAENTETFAQFAKGGGENLAKAAIEARKLGLNLGTVASIAENLLDFESSIEKEMEASMLLGRQMNLDKARELALSGDLAGLAEEVKNQVGSQAEFEAMNVVQRKALAAAMGVTVSDLSKMVAGEKTSAQLAEDRVKTEKDLARLQMISAAALVVAAGAKTAGLAGALIGAGIAAGAVFGLPSKVTGLEKGGVVKKSGIAEVHKGEVFSGTRNEMGMGNGQTNKLLRELIEQNEILMNKLTNRVGDIALSNAV